MSNIYRHIRAVRALAATLLPALVAAGCASMGNPSGGPRDEEPPRFVSANPPQGTAGVTPRRVTLDFDEIVNVKDAYSKVVVSPVGKETAKVSSNGRRVTVQLPDTLEENATYTIDFGDAIEDNNEGNKLQGFTYTFATGPEIDTLRVSGMVLAARDLEPQQGMLVGVYSNLADSAFATLPLERIAKTDDRGRFTIRGLKPGTYRVFALGDLDNDYFRANPEEDMAWSSTLVVPSTERVSTTDSIYNLKTGAVDTVVSRMRTRFLPNDILLRSFSSDYKAQYLDKYERIDSTRLYLKFNAPNKQQLPTVEILGAGEPTEELALRERNAAGDSIVYWLRRPETVATDTLRVALRYLRTDSTRSLSPAVDTLEFVTHHPRPAKAGKKKKKKDEEADTVAAPPVPLLQMRAESGTSQEVWLPLLLQTATPLARVDSTAFHLMVRKDTVWEPMNVALSPAPPDSLSLRRLQIAFPWRYGTSYRLAVDTLALTDIYGVSSGPFTHDLNVKPEEDYCALTFNITGRPDSVPAFVELLNQDKPVRTEPVADNAVTFRYLAPGKYYARIIFDWNGNGLYDTGDFDSLRQPDLAYYYPKAVNIKKNWEKTESWDIFAMTVDQQKPEAILKNKPEADKRRRAAKKNASQQTGEDEEDEEYFDPTRNPFDPNDRGRRNQNQRF